jgi:hypothetical protein
MRQVTCMCETSFDAELPEEVDLDAQAEVLDQILKGDFLAVTCPNCGSRLKPELRVRIVSKKRRLDLVCLPEIERMSVYLGSASVPAGAEVIVGYAELFERARILSDGLDAEAIEIVKYLVAEKAEDEAPDAEISIAYAGKKEGKLLFHVSGLKEGELAILPLAPSIYDKTLADKAKTKAEPPFDRVFTGPYRSIKILAVDEAE